MEPCPVPLPVPANPPPADDRTRDAASIDDELLAVDLLDCEVVPRIRPWTESASGGRRASRQSRIPPV